jgi:hypothetical protein
MSGGRAGGRSYESLVDRSAGIPRLEFRVHRLSAAYRFTYAFHAREVRFERDLGSGFERAFPETFSFHADRHDPAELYLRLEDLYTNPVRLAPGATRRDTEEMVLRLLEVLPTYLAEILARLEDSGESGPFVRASEDVAVLVQVALRFIADKGLSEEARLQGAAFHLARLRLHALFTVLAQRVPVDELERYASGETEAERSADPYDVTFFRALAEGDESRMYAVLIGATESAYHAWLEDVCLDETNRAFEREDSPFQEREVEVLEAVTVSSSGRVDRTRDLSPFLRRVGSRDCSRLLKKLETWFLRQYDVHHAAAVIHHEAALAHGPCEPDRRLSRHSTRNYVMACSGVWRRSWRRSSRTTGPLWRST